MGRWDGDEHFRFQYLAEIEESLHFKEQFQTFFHLNKRQGTFSVMSGCRHPSTSLTLVRRGVK